MEIEKKIQQLAELERHVHTLDTLIRHVNSMSDEELKKEWPRILKAHQALATQGNSLPAAKHLIGQFLRGDEDAISFRKRFLRRLWSVRVTMKKAASFF